MEFGAEVEILARVRHDNLLSLRGYCAEGQERLIVYDYMPNLSLMSHLHGQHSSESLLDWTRRMNIAIGSAEGITWVSLLPSPIVCLCHLSAMKKHCFVYFWNMFTALYFLENPLVQLVLENKCEFHAFIRKNTYVLKFDVYWIFWFFMIIIAFNTLGSVRALSLHKWRSFLLVFNSLE